MVEHLINQSVGKEAVAVILTNSERRILWVNDDFTKITGYKFEEVIGRKPNILQGENTEKEAIEEIRAGLKRKVSFKAEITNYRKDGEEYLCKLLIHPIFGLNGKLTNFLAFEVDGDVTDDSLISLMQIRRKYNVTKLDKSEVDLFAALTKLFEEDRIFLNANLKMGEIAKKLKITSKYLSQIVHNQSSMSMTIFINRYRITEVKSKIMNEKFQHLTTYGIAQTCGFKNKSTFYKVFKEITNMTPKDYVRISRK